VSIRQNQLGQPIGEPVADWRPPPVPPRQAIDGRYCRLEPLDASRHASDLFRANRADVEGRIWTYLAYGPFDSETEYRDWVRQRSESVDPMFFAVIDASSRTARGVLSYLRIDPPGGAIEVGHICYAPALQRTPAATEAVYLLMREAFALGYRRFEWKCDALNAPSRAAALRYGLTFEGIFRQATVYKGRNRDTAWYSAIDSEWPRLDAAFKAWLDPSNFDASGKQRMSLKTLTLG